MDFIDEFSDARNEHDDAKGNKMGSQETDLEGWDELKESKNQEVKVEKVTELIVKNDWEKSDNVKFGIVDFVSEIIGWIDFASGRHGSLSRLNGWFQPRYEGLPSAGLGRLVREHEKEGGVGRRGWTRPL